ncbi:hypothetical protein CYMTET_25511, partial [Cymbomonas tetramitiformis]
EAVLYICSSATVLFVLILIYLLRISFVRVCCLETIVEYEPGGEVLEPESETCSCKSLGGVVTGFVMDTGSCIPAVEQSFCITCFLTASFCLALRGGPTEEEEEDYDSSHDDGSEVATPCSYASSAYALSSAGPVTEGAEGAIHHAKKKRKNKVIRGKKKTFSSKESGSASGVEKEEEGDEENGLNGKRRSSVYVLMQQAKKSLKAKSRGVYRKRGSKKRKRKVPRVETRETIKEDPDPGKDEQSVHRDNSARAKDGMHTFYIPDSFNHRRDEPADGPYGACFFWIPTADLSWRQNSVVEL